MGFTKTKDYDPDILEIANVAKALGHPARLAIIQFLVETRSCITTDIVNELPIAQPTVSQHLKELRQAGLIQGEVEGNAICYCLNEAGFSRFKQYIGTILEKLRISNCC